MKKRIFYGMVIMIITLFSIMPKIVNAETKDVWIDNTVDNSTTEVTGLLIVKNLITGEETTTTLYDEVAASTYSEASNPSILVMIDEAKTTLATKAREYQEEFDVTTIIVTESTGKVWDNRVYETIEDNDAVLIGDADYIGGSYGVSDPKARTHIASGDYGKQHFYRVEAYVEITGEEENKLEILEGNKTYIKGSNTDVVLIASGSLADLKGIEIDNGNPIPEENMTLAEGSTILTLKAAFLEASSLGEHTITFKYENGEVETKLTIVEKEEEKPNNEVIVENNTNNPNTGDIINQNLLMLGISILGFISLGILLRRKKISTI